jgi:hypothetical protein
MAGEAARVAVEPRGSERDTTLLAQRLQLPDEAIKELNCHRCKTILNGFKSCEGLMLSHFAASFCL